MTAMLATGAPQMIEGTWDEIAGNSEIFTGRRLRVFILPDEQAASSQTVFAPTGRFAARAAAALSLLNVPASQLEIDEGERELKDLAFHINENRRRDGAEPVF